MATSRRPTSLSSSYENVAAPGLLTQALRHRTRTLHRDAERSGIIRALLAGSASLAGYTLFLRNLLPAYEAMERALAAKRAELLLLAREEVCRSAAIRADLASIAGAGSAADLPILPAAADYADRITQIAGDVPRLLGHAYVRYLGDLNGGQILARRLAHSLGLTSAALHFYDFPGIADLDRFKRDYRDALDGAVVETQSIANAAEEAALAFALNIRVSEAVAAAGAEPSPDARSAGS